MFKQTYQTGPKYHGNHSQTHTVQTSKSSLFRPHPNHFIVDGAKRAGQVGFRSGQSGLQVNQVASQTSHFYTGQSGCRLSRVAGRVELTRIFQTSFFFFFEIDAICQLFMSSLTVIRFSLVILLPITTKHLT